MAVSFRQPWYPPISKQPTPEELARHLRLIYQALNDHDTAIVKLHERTSGEQPLTPEPLLPLSVLLEQPEGIQR